MTRQVRSRRIQNGLVLANGGVLSYQHAICLSSKHRRDGSDYPDSRKDSDGVVEDVAPAVATFAEGEATIEVSLFVSRCRKIFSRTDLKSRRTRSSSAEMESQKQPSSSVD